MYSIPYFCCYPPAARSPYRRHLWLGPPALSSPLLLSLLLEDRKLPNNGVGSRVAPITWAVNNSPNSYYTITETKLHWVPKLTITGYPLVLVDGQVVPADEKYSAVQYEKARTRREELIRATRAGEELDDLEDVEEKEVELTPEEKEEVGRKAGILKPKGEAYGWGIWNGTSSDPTSEAWRSDRG